MSSRCDFSSLFVRQRTITTIAGYVAGYMNKIPAVELEDAAARNAGVNDFFSAEQLDGFWKSVRNYAPYLVCLREDDFDTIFQRTKEKLSPDRLAAVKKHERWFRERLAVVWRELLAALRAR